MTRKRKFRVLSVAALAVAAWLRNELDWSRVEPENEVNGVSRNRPQDLDVSVCDDECLWKTGTNGKWIQDWDFARDHGQYHLWPYPHGPSRRTREWKFKPDADSPFQWRTSWRWVDSSPGCQVDIMTREKLCSVLTKLGIARILFYGDSMSGGMYHALMNKLAEKHGDVSASAYGTGSFVCGDENEQTTVEVLFERDSGGNSMPNLPRGVYELNFRVQRFLADALEKRVLAIFNIGAHYHNFTHFQEDIEVLLDTVKEISRHQDLYFFRSVSPAHEGCGSRRVNDTQGERIEPLKSYSEYQVSNQHIYDWDSFAHYNHHAMGRINAHNARGRGQPFHYLNIWNMTALRRDGHNVPKDCLHYIDPGPVDWWNHLLFTYLQRMSQRVHPDDVDEADSVRGNCVMLRPLP